MKVYTKRGDDGTTGLLYGGRVEKDDLRTAAYGTVDETVSALGLARAELGGDEPHPLHDEILELQRELFCLGAQLATRAEDWGRLEVGLSRVDDDMVAELERRIDASTERHPLPQEFVVPGNNRAAAALDLARTVCRRAERETVALKRAGLLADETPLHYLNRCSDYLFVLARELEGHHVPSRRSTDA